jgi:predicted GH43/DUF377 family glycosyl hydrolase
MRINVNRLPLRINPDSKRVIARFFYNGDERAEQVVKSVMKLSNQEVYDLAIPLLQEFSKRHRNITKVFSKNCKKLKNLFDKMEINYDNLDDYRKYLIGSYFTNEYSIESAAFFNPSVVEDPNQKFLIEGEKRLIISFRAVGEGHISSIVFRRAVIDAHCNINVLPVSNYVSEADIVKNEIYNKKLFFKKASDSKIDLKVISAMNAKLGDKFDYMELRRALIDSKNLEENDLDKLEYDKMLWLSDTYHEMSFSKDTDLSDRVIFPISEFERKGIEDARFVRFIKEDGSVIYYATYTAFDGAIIMPKLMQTTDFYTFKVSPLHGKGSQNKNLALFPRKINGKYAMMSRIDGWNNYLMYSDRLTVWDNPIKLQSPLHAWEFIQIGNCGSPIETEKGWLIITHGVGPMRRYCLGASLLDLNNPSIEIGRLEEPLLVPNTDEREGYVPNVLYSCGSIIHQGNLIIPYGLSDYCSSFAIVPIDVLIEKIMNTED